MINIEELKTKIFADGAHKNGILEMYEKPYIKGFTTNPTLMKKAGIKNYKEFAFDILSMINGKSISFEVFSDDFKEMEKQAREIATWGENVYVKIPITNTKNESTSTLIKRLSNENVRVNVTAMMTVDQVKQVLPALENSPGAYVSIFAGRIADTGRDPIPIMKQALELLSYNDRLELIWASPRELLNIFQANEIGCHVITVTKNILDKIPNINKELDVYSLETVKMFYNDAQFAGYKI